MRILSREWDKHKTFLAIAKKLGELGTCSRKKVGAVIIRDGRCISWSYNGAPPGLPHCSENDHGYDTLPYFVEEHQREGCLNATHAEANAIAFAARQGISTEGATLYLTLAPCEVCARLLIAAGISRVVYSEAYRDPAGAQLLAKAGLLVLP